MTNYKYKFSVISAVYNVEPFLREAIDSVINQTIGIKNIQLILVDDGTPDNSGKICDEYAKKYPDNIFVIHKENGGVSSARNLGLKSVKGKYVNFMDSDDKWDKSALKKVWEFFEKNQDKTDMVALPIKYFDGARGDHMLNYKFNAGSRVVNLKEEWDTPQMHVASAFFKSELFEKIEFDTDLAYAEDSKVVQQVLLKKQTIGLLNKSAYLYRKRSSGEASAIQSSGQKPNWYLPVMENYHLSVLNLAQEKFKKLPKFLQMTLMYDIQWRLKQPGLAANKNLTDRDKEKYLNYISKLLKHIDDDVIIAQKHIWGEQKLLAFKLKYQKEPEIIETENSLLCGINDTANISVKCKSVIDFLEIKDNILKITGTVSFYNLNYKNADIYLLVNGERVDIENVVDNGVVTCLDSEMVFKKGYSVELPLEGEKNYVIKTGANINGVDIIYDRITFGKYSPLSDKYRRSYYRFGKRIVSTGLGTLFITKAIIARRVVKEYKLLCQILKRDGILGIGAAVLRAVLILYKALKIKPIWLISDRASVAGDNGEAFFRYVRQNHKNIDARFVLLEGSADLEEIKKIGPVVKKDSIKHKLLAVVSEYIISSHAEFEIFNPLRARMEPFKSLWVKTKFVFLQHGITQNNISDWIGKQNKNFYGVVVAANPEYDSFFKYDYRYGKENIWLTGFPRFDRLEDSGEKIITLMPTWRKYLTTGWNSQTDIWGIVPDFAESNYYKFYNGLINNEKLLGAAKKLGYQINFFPHPSLQPHIDIFEKQDDVEFLGTNTTYREVYSKSALLLTDFSSAAFDFAYLRKPVLYTHFDREEFYDGGHICTDGYFQYERDGFGEVEYDLDSTVNRIIEYMEKGCHIKDVYRKRVDTFFAFNDKDNCKRLYEMLVK